MNTLNNNNKSAKRPDLPARVPGLTRGILRAWLPAALLWILIIAIALALIGCEPTPFQERSLDGVTYDTALMPGLRVRDDAGRAPDEDWLRRVTDFYLQVAWCLQLHGLADPPDGTLLLVLVTGRLTGTSGREVDGIFWWPEAVIQWNVQGTSKWRTLRHEFTHALLFLGGAEDWHHTNVAAFDLCV